VDGRHQHRLRHQRILLLRHDNQEKVSPVTMTAQKLVLALSLLCVWLECEAKSFDINGVIALQDEELQELFSERLNGTIPPPVVPADNFTIDIPEPKDFDNTNTRPRGGDAGEDSFNSASRACRKFNAGVVSLC
ncbi:hypothetical protein Hamer_G022466, partial [Homarus americanus]